MKTESPNRVRGMTVGARMGQFAKTKGQRDKAYYEVLGALRARKVKAEDFWPVHVELTRVSAGSLDGDNLQSAFKSCRDGVAKALGFKNDADPKIRFSYRQKRGARGYYGVEVLVQRTA
jgi:hypothetical protein